MKIGSLRPNQEVEAFYAVGSCLRKTSRNGKPYIELTLYDATGQIRAFIWGYTDESAPIAGSIVWVTGMTGEYNGALTLRVESIRTATYDEVDISCFQPVVPGGIEFWKGRLMKIVATVNDECCRALIDSFTSDPVFMEQFATAPGGIWVHHPYVGGLMEHTVCVMELADFISKHNAALVNRDVLLAAAFLHDIGKVREMGQLPLKEYTTDGKLMGHIAMGCEMIDNKIRANDTFPEELARAIKHTILSHHGEAEFGSPVRPATTEAVALHLIDNLDAKLNHVYCHMGASNPSDEWTTYDKYLKNEIYQKKWRGQKGCRPWNVRLSMN